MKNKNILIMVMVLMILSAQTVFALDLRTYEIRFETYPFYEEGDTSQSQGYRATRGMQFKKEGETEIIKGTVKVPCWKVSFSKIEKQGQQHLQSMMLLSDSTESGENWLEVKEGKLYYIAKAALSEEHFKLVSGLSWGALTLPFKLRTDDGTISGNAALSGFLGYNQRIIFGWQTMFVAAAGLSVISTQDINTKTSDNKTAFTWTIGIAVPIDKSFQAGLFLGTDHIGGQTGDDWGHEDELWLSIGIGYAFLQ